MAPSDPEKPALSLPAERERTIARLGEHFANDNITLEELERLIEQAYRAPDMAALEALTRDLPAGPRSAVVPAAPAPVPDLYVPEEGRVISVMSETRRKGMWHLPRTLDVWCLMSETHLDLTHVALPAGVTEIEVHALMSSVKIVVPRHVRVVMQAGGFMATVTDRTDDPPPLGTGAPVLRITGFVMMAELKVKVAP